MRRLLTGCWALALLLSLAAPARADSLWEPNNSFFLEVLNPDTLGSDGLKVVTIALGEMCIRDRCIRLRNKENQKKGGTSKSNRNEQEEKAYEETNTQHSAHLVYGLSLIHI